MELQMKPNNQKLREKLEAQKKKKYGKNQR